MLPTTSLLGRGEATAGCRRALSADLPQAKVLVLGESGAGKTTLVRALKGNPVPQPPWTVGATIDYLLHFHKAGTTQERPYFIELWDVGGSRAHRNARRTFYRNVAGAILVHDLSNRKTEHNLRSWVQELFAAGGTGFASPYTPFGFGGSSLSHSQRAGGAALAMGAQTSTDEENGFGCVERDIPVLVVGTKLDQTPAGASGNARPSPAVSKLAQELGAEELWLNALSPPAAGSTNALKLDRFYDRVVERLEHKRLAASGGQGTPTAAPMGTADARRRRLAFP